MALYGRHFITLNRCKSFLINFVILKWDFTLNSKQNNGEDGIKYPNFGLIWDGFQDNCPTFIIN